jgi:hypothetical protein
MLRQTQFRIQMKDARTLESIITAGGAVYVATAGSPAKATLFTAAGAALANPVTPTRGFIEFFTAETVSEVDLYVQAPGGQFEVYTGVKASGPNEILIDTANRHGAIVVPFSIANTVANTETNTGFIVPANAAVLPNPLVRVTTLDAGMTIDVGTLSTDSGDADGFIDGLSLAAAALVKATLANGAITMGALLWVQDSANAGDEAPEANVSMQGKAITYTLSASTDTAAGFVILPYLLAA